MSPNLNSRAQGGAAAPQLLCAGHVTLDRYGPRLLAGGSVTYAALTWSGLGGEARLVTSLGPDLPQELLPAGVAIAARASQTTTVFENRYGPDGSREQVLESRAAPVGLDLLPGDWRQPQVFFLAPVINELDPRAWIAAVRSSWVALGLQGLLRRVRGGSLPGRVGAVPFDFRADWLAAVDVVFLSDDDCRHQPELPRCLAERVAQVVLTKGRQGCVVYEGGRSFEVPAHPARESDPTGAGDTFAAGYLFALATGFDTHWAACLGNACASLVIEGQGPQSLDRVAQEARARALRLAAGGVQGFT